MSLRFKINLVVGLLTLLFVGAVLALQLRGMRASVNEEVQAASRVAAQLLDRMAWRYTAQGTPGMLSFLQGIGRVRSNDITLVGADGETLYASPPSPYKAGRDAPAWFARLVAPLPIERVIEVADGRLLVRSNASRAVLDAWDDLVKLALAAAALLVVVNGLVFWVVGRAARPFGEIVEALNRVEGGRFDVRLAPLAGREAGAIGAAFNRMLGVLRENIENERRAARAEQQLSDSRELTRWIEHHIEQERRMIARELHDELGQSVTAMRSMALSIAQRAKGRDAESEQAARLIADESSRLYDAMHGLIPRLTPLVLDNFGLADALADLVERTRRSQPGVEIALDVQLGEASLGGDAALALYRAAQEGVTNALRHGGATRLALEVRAGGLDHQGGGDGAGSGEGGGEGKADAGPPGVHLRLRDDGRGLAPGWADKEGHYGLRWLGERVESLHGRLRVEAASPRGVQLQVWLPLEAS